MILGLFTGLTSHGGIDRAGRQINAELMVLAKEKGLGYKALCLNDPIGIHHKSSEHADLGATGFGRRKMRFSIAALRLATSAKLVYVGHPNLGPLALFAKLVNPRLDYIITGHGIDVWNRLAFPRRLAMKRARALTAPSQFSCDAMVNVQGVSPEKVMQLPWSFDIHSIQPPPDGQSKRSTDIPQGKILLTISRLTKNDHYKGIDSVIEALPRLLETHEDLYYIVVGDGDDIPRLRQLAVVQEVEHRVLFVGAVTDQELQLHLKAADVVVMPSEKEGFGLIFLEAMAFGKPVLGGNHGGTPEVVINNETGILINHGDVDGIISSLLRLLNDSSLRHRMGKAGKRRLEQTYSPAIFRRRLRAILDEVWES